MILIIIVLLTLYNFARTTVYAENHKELPSLLAEEEALNFALLHVDNLLLNTKKPSSLYSMSRLFPFYEFSNGTVSEIRGLTYVPSYYNYLIHESYYLNLGVTSQQVMNMASTYFNFTSLSEVNPISFIDATTEIINSRPIYMKWRRYDSEAKEYKYHANAMRGIMDVSPYRYYTLVNSWSNESYITLTVNSNPSSQTWSTGDRIYTWDKSIIIGGEVKA